ncbi:MAG: hypothetical protein R3208_03795 [Ketobacteraceae bacterium]|nr:hypothetical protein [Ketobacteraceae bacterium]
MNKKTGISLLISVVMGCSFTAQANPDIDPMINMSIDMMKQSGELARGASCLGVSEAKLESSTRKAMRDCFSRFNMEQEDQLNACMEKSSIRSLGISKADFDRCGDSDDMASEDALEQKIMALMDQFGEDGPTEAQMQQLEALQQQQMARGMEQMEQFLQASQKAGEGTLDQITLPVYKNAQVMMHLTQGMNAFAGNNTLPAATFASQDSISAIVAFYKEKLPGFGYKQLPGGEHIFMESMPKNFDLLTHLNAYTQTPHVMISRAAAGPGMPEGTQTMIEIAYRK